MSRSIFFGDFINKHKRPFFVAIISTNIHPPLPNTYHRQWSRSDFIIRRSYCPKEKREECRSILPFPYYLFPY